jgi:ABC-type polysaccharide/polyol phosphate export permease
MMPEMEQPLEVRTCAPLESEQVRIIVPVKRRVRLRDLPRDAPVIGVLAARDFKIKYKQSVLGPLWLLFQPLALFAGFLIAFRSRTTLGHGVPYVVFALSGLMCWSFFQAAMTIGSSSLITNFQLVRFTPCPRLAFPVAAMLASLPSLLVPATGALIATAAAGLISPRTLLLPLGFSWLFVLTVGVVALLSSLAVRFRDIVNMMPFLLSIGLFLAPVGYSLNGLSHWLRVLIELNPLTGILEACRWMLVSGYRPAILAIYASLVASAVILLVGCHVFARLETTMADEI